MEKPKRVYWHKNQWQYKPTAIELERGLKHWEPLGTDLDKVPGKLERLRLISREETSQQSFTWLANWYMTEVAPKRLAPRTVQDRFACIKQLLKTFADWNYQTIEPHHVQKHIMDRAETAPRRAKMEYSTMQQIYRWAIRYGYANRNPASDLWTPPERPRDRYVTHEELDTFCRLNPDWGGPMALLGYALGQRLGDILALTYDNKQLVFKTQKTKKRAVIEMTPYLRSLIETLNPQIQEGELIIKNANGDPYNAVSFGHRWRRCMNRFIAAGGERFTFHDLKAKFVTDSQTLGLDPVKQALHDSPKTTQIYLRNRETTEVESLRFIPEDAGVRPLTKR